MPKPQLEKRLEAVEYKLTELAESLASHVASVPRILWGWKEIAAYMRRPERTLSRYTKLYGLPVFRLGKHVLSSPTAIDAWLITVQQQRRAKERGASEKQGGSW